jgi:hypothetical protein
VRLRWDGAPVAEETVGQPREGTPESARASWGETLVAEIPAALVTRAESELVVEAGTWDGLSRPLLACHYWIAQPR